MNQTQELIEAEFDVESVFDTDLSAEPATLILEAEYTIDGCTSDVSVFKLRDFDMYRAVINAKKLSAYINSKQPSYNEPLSYLMHIVKDELEGWVSEFGMMQSAEVTAIGRLIDEHMN